MKTSILMVLILVACDRPAPPAPPPPPKLTRAQTQVLQCRKLCESGGMSIRRFAAGEPPVCECAARADGPDALDGVGVGIGLELGRGLARELLR